MNAKLLQSAPAPQIVLRAADCWVVLARHVRRAADSALLTPSLFAQSRPLASGRGAATLVHQFGLGGATFAHHAR